MNNNKGFAMAGTLMAILIIVSTVLAILYLSMTNTTTNTHKSKTISQDMVNEFNGKERLFTLLNKNISFEGSVEYEDLEKIYNLTTINEKYENISTYVSQYNPLSFNINNKTPIEIAITASPYNQEMSCTYNVNLMYNNSDILNGTGNNLSSDVNFIVDESKIYNMTTGDTKYGRYTLNIDSTNCTISAFVNYDKLEEREVSISGASLKRTVIIENKDDSVNVKFKEGGV